MRAFMAVRSRYAEDGLAQAVERGVSQYVLLGAGLDTFGYRNPFEGCVRVFEVDHPATQAWKRAQVEAAGIVVPPSLTYTPVNFERQTIMDGLVASGFNPAAPAFFAWLGVTMYLARETVMATFKMIASSPKGSGVVFDYGIEPSMLGFMERIVVAEFSRRVAAIGEPWTTFFVPSELDADLRAGRLRGRRRPRARRHQRALLQGSRRRVEGRDGSPIGKGHELTYRALTASSTSSAWPFTFTLSQRLTTLPSAPMRYVVRTMPM